jgi:hypothetical protein
MGAPELFEDFVNALKLMEHILIIYFNSRLHTEVESVSFLSRAKIVYQGVAEVN